MGGTGSVVIPASPSLEEERLAAALAGGGAMGGTGGVVIPASPGRKEERLAAALAGGGAGWNGEVGGIFVEFSNTLEGLTCFGNSKRFLKNAALTTGLLFSLSEEEKG